MNRADADKGTSWAMILLFFLLFFPVGIILMIAKLHKEKHLYTTNGKAVMAVGCLIISIGLIGWMTDYSNAQANQQELQVGGTLAILFVFGGGGLALIQHGNKYRSWGVKHLRYVDLISSISIDTLYDIAAVYPKSYDEVRKDLQHLVYDGFFPGYYLDLQTRKFVAPNQKKAETERKATKKPASQMAEPKEETPTVVQVVKCPNCGATTMLKGSIGECEYCASPLQK